MKKIYHFKNPFLLVLNNQIKNFNNGELTTFCEKFDIEKSISNFLSFKEPNKPLPKNINILLGLQFPKYYFITSKDFWDSLALLPTDFKKDIKFLINLKRAKEFLIDNLEIVDYLKKIHGDKYFNLLKNGVEYVL